jgi:thiol:disulfide interchange protein/DsbC/DsbD-like thiol-disulfide interchange protein
MTQFATVLFSGLVALAVLLADPSTARAQGLLEKAQQAAATQQAQLGMVRAGELQAGLVAQSSAARPGEPITVGLRLIHDPQWHTYWRNPGDSGLPTQVEWELPDGWKAEPIQWPTPKRMAIGPLANYGYEGEIVLPMVLQVPRNAQPGSNATLKAHVSWLICKDVCIPGEAYLAIQIPVARQADQVAPSAYAPEFERALKSIPGPDPVRKVSAYLLENALVLAWAEPEGQVPSGYFFPYLEGLIGPAAAQKLSRTEAGVRLDIPLGEASSAAVAEARKRGRIEGIWVTPGAAGVEWRAGLSTQEPLQSVALISAGLTAAQEYGAKGSADADVSALWLAMAGALVGGMILNLMPCVFPVIGLKVLSFAQSAHSRTAAMQQAAMFSAGVVISFLALAGLLIGLRAAGEAVGWGFQLQSPWVVLSLALLFVAIAVNLFGVFEFGLLGVRVANLQFVEKTASGSGATGSFFSGVLAVVVASPCTAPFMGSAIGFAATAGTLQTFAVFFALGVGMALPYIVLAAWPGLLSALPRPGPWMARFKQAMAFPMLAAAAWLFWVLASLQSADIVLWALVAAIALSLALWVYGSLIQTGQARILSWICLLGALALLVYASLQAARPVAPSASVTSPAATSSMLSAASDTAIAWQPWAPGLAERLQSQGKTVFVDFTATWCISCRANKVRVLDTATIADAFKQAGVHAVRADWTRRDAEIANELARHGRNGVPLYLVYSKNGGAPKILSEWLTEKEVLDAIR